MCQLCHTKSSPWVSGCKVYPTVAHYIIFYWNTNMFFKFSIVKELANDLQTLNLHYTSIPQAIFMGVSATHNCYHSVIISQIARFMGPTWGPPGSCQPHVGPQSSDHNDISTVVGYLAVIGRLNQHFLYSQSKITVNQYWMTYEICN